MFPHLGYCPHFEIQNIHNLFKVSAAAGLVLDRFKEGLILSKLQASLEADLLYEILQDGERCQVSVGT